MKGGKLREKVEQDERQEREEGVMHAL